jgi:hypothetical protein
MHLPNTYSNVLFYLDLIATYGDSRVTILALLEIITDYVLAYYTSIHKLTSYTLHDFSKTRNSIYHAYISPT